jgi:RNA polymerase sigma-70 factor (ECF subfamily)
VLSLRRDPSWHARFLRGDKDVIEEIYRDTFNEVRLAAGSILRDPADRDAVVHEVFLELISSRHLRESHRGGKMGAWLGAIARHQAIDFARREKRLTPLSDLNEPTTTVDPLEEIRAEIVRFATRLDPQRRQLVELRYIAGMTQMEAAAALGMPRSTLEDWERQLRRALHDFLSIGEGQGQGQGPGDGRKQVMPT